MANYWNKHLPHQNGYPGNGYYYVLCDVCGKKLRAREAIYIRDKYNLLTNLLVCKADADKTNPQTYIKSFRERQIDNPRLIRSEPLDRFAFISDVSEIEDGDSSDPTGRNPGPPQFLTIFTVATTEIELQWIGPLDAGSSAICGWRIERESPTGGGFSDVVANTEEVATYFKDTGLTTATQYNYRVSAVNKNGTGDPSNEAEATTA